MIAETDDGTRDPQTLARVSIQGTATVVPPDDASYEDARAIVPGPFPAVGV